MRIAVGGIRHETNTFSTLRTRLQDFHIRRDDAIMQSAVWEPFQGWNDAQGCNGPHGLAERDPVMFLPTLDASAAPHGLVERAAYLQLKHELLERLTRALPVDGVYLDLHGAMEVEAIGDGESDLVSAIRELVGPDVLV